MSQANSLLSVENYLVLYTLRKVEEAEKDL